MSEQLAKATAVVWDFDGVFYNYDTVPNEGFYKLCNYSDAAAACSLVPSLGIGDAMKIASQSYMQYNDCMTGFTPYAHKAQMSEHEFKETLFEKYHEFLFESMTDMYPYLINDDRSLTAKFNKLRKQVKHGVLSHASRDNFLTPSLERMKLTPFFNKASVWGFKEFDYQSKGVSTEGMQRLLGRLGKKSSETIFVEDSKHNLQIAKKELPGITTVLISANDDKPQGIDYMFRSQGEFLDAMIKSKQKVNTSFQRFF